MIGKRLIHTAWLENNAGEIKEFLDAQDQD